MFGPSTSGRGLKYVQTTIRVHRLKSGVLVYPLRINKSINQNPNGSQQRIVHRLPVLHAVFPLLFDNDVPNDAKQPVELKCVADTFTNNLALVHRITVCIRYNYRRRQLQPGKEQPVVPSSW